MDIKFEQVRVITPGLNKCLKISQNGKVLMYMKEPFYDLPHYHYTVEEVPIEEGKAFHTKTFKGLTKLFRKNK